MSAVVVGLFLVVGGLALAAPAHAAPAHRSGDSLHDQAALIGDAGRGPVLPFAALDLAILVLGGAVLTLVAAGAPLLFRPLRHTAPVLAGTATASEALLSRAEQAACAHAKA